MDETEGMTEREKIMWKLIHDIAELLISSSESAHDRYELNALLHNARIEMADVKRSEDATHKLSTHR